MAGSTVRTLRIVMPMVAVVSAAVFVPWILIRALLTPLPGSVQEQVDIATRFKLDGIIVYVDRAGSEPVTYSAGWKNREDSIPADPQSLFKIASISKLYVAVAATKLINEGRLSLDGTLAEYFPELSGRIEYAESITLQQMIQHRSGIPNLTDHPDYPWTDPPKTSEESLQYALDLPARFEPGKKYHYSNTNYLLIAELIDKEVGYNHQQYIKEVILEPLGLKNTFGTMNDVDPERMMSGYFVGYEPDIKGNYFGSMVATAEDVGIFLRALINGSLLTDREQKLYSSLYEYEHTGLLPGYQSIARYHEDIDAVVVQFVNTSGDESWTLHEIIYKRVVKILRKA